VFQIRIQFLWISVSDTGTVGTRYQ